MFGRYFISQIQQAAHANMLKLMSSVITTTSLTLFIIQSFFMAEKSHWCLHLHCINDDPNAQDFDKRWLHSVVYWIAKPSRFSSPHCLWHPYSCCWGICVLIYPDHKTLSTTLSLGKPFELVGKETLSLIESDICGKQWICPLIWGAYVRFHLWQHSHVWFFGIYPTIT